MISYVSEQLGIQIDLSYQSEGLTCSLPEKVKPLLLFLQAIDLEGNGWHYIPLDCLQI